MFLLRWRMIRVIGACSGDVEIRDTWELIAHEDAALFHGTPLDVVVARAWDRLSHLVVENLALLLTETIIGRSRLAKRVARVIRSRFSIDIL